MNVSLISRYFGSKKGLFAAVVSRLRAELLLALFSGVALLRWLLPDEPLVSGDGEALRAELGRLIRCVGGSDPR